ncbi:MAG: permease-like cell division protein FtsX [Weeksellaceae bacterium]|jgi:hypothetical protein|nr:permease-like cell division protein FtsX [Weeksellaceae bacterium]
MKILICFLVLITGSCLTAQENEWHKVDNGLMQKIIKKGSDINVKNNDSVILSVYGIKESEEVDLEDLSKLIWVPLKLTFTDLKLNLGVNSFYSDLKKDSEYLLRRGYPENRIYRYSLYLSDNPDENRIKELKDFLEKDSRINKIEFISKEKASEIALKELGITEDDVYKENFFPASFDIESNEELNLKKMQDDFADLIDEITDDSSILDILFRIQT